MRRQPCCIDGVAAEKRSSANGSTFNRVDVAKQRPGADTCVKTAGAVAQERKCANSRLIKAAAKACKSKVPLGQAASRTASAGCRLRSGRSLRSPAMRSARRGHLADNSPSDDELSVRRFHLYFSAVGPTSSRSGQC